LSAFDPAGFRSFLNEVEALGLRVIFTEMDVTDTAFPLDYTTRDADVAAWYSRYAGVALAHPSALGLLTWGLSDKYTWLNAYAPRADGSPERPLPIDAQMALKPAYWALQTAYVDR